MREHGWKGSGKYSDGRLLTSEPYSQAAGPKPRLYPKAYTKMKATQTMSAALLLLSGNTSGSAPLNCARHQPAAPLYTTATAHRGSKTPTEQHTKCAKHQGTNSQTSLPPSQRTQPPA